MLIAACIFRRFRTAVPVSWLGTCLVLCGPVGQVACGTNAVVDSKGFESPFTLSNLHGQQGWVGTEGPGSGITATVQNTIASSGSQALTVQRAAVNDGFGYWAKPVSGFPTQRFVTIDWDMRVEGPVGTLPQLGPFFGVAANDSNQSEPICFGPSPVCALGSLGVDATSSEVLYQNTNGEIVPVPTLMPTFVEFGQWNHFRLLLDFQTDTYRGYVNGLQVVSTDFIDKEFGLNDFSDADIMSTPVQPEYAGLAGSATFDNFIVLDGLTGDYDGDGDVDAFDYTTWRQTFGNAVAPAGSSADGNRNGVIDAADYTVWRDNLGLHLTSFTAGDYNRDGQVDVADYAPWRQTFGNGVSPAGSSADGSGNALVDAADYVVWRNNLGPGSAASSGSTLSAVTVPEPAVAVLLLSAVATLLFRGRCQRAEI